MPRMRNTYVLDILFYISVMLKKEKIQKNNEKFVSHHTIYTLKPIC